MSCKKITLIVLLAGIVFKIDTAPLGQNYGERLEERLYTTDRSLQEKIAEIEKLKKENATLKNSLANALKDRLANEHGSIREKEQLRAQLNNIIGVENYDYSNQECDRLADQQDQSKYSEYNAVIFFAPFIVTAAVLFYSYVKESERENARLNSQ